jgi:hypothetical protein
MRVSWIQPTIKPGLVPAFLILLFTNMAAAQIATDLSSALTSTGSAAILAGPQCESRVLLLTSAQQNQAGSVFTTNRVEFDSKFTFRTFFHFQMTDPNSQASDGMAFVIQTEGANAVGPVGGYLGYGGITPSVAIEFDTFQNPWDINDNHVAILTNGAMNDLDPQTPYGVTACQPKTGLFGCMNNGDVWSVWIDYDGDNIKVAIADNSTTRPPNLISYPVDLLAILGQKSAFIGFTGGTGSGAERHIVEHWLFL